ACRRQMIGLARLSNELESLAGKPPVVVAEPAWSRWYGAVAQWFDFSGWNWGWTATATACGLLLTVFAANTLRQMRAPQNASASLTANSAPANILVAQPTPQPADALVARVPARPESE